MTAASVSVVIPTIGRPELLRGALESLAVCVPPPAEVLVVDQSSGLVSEPVVADVGIPGACVVPCRGTGRGLAVNDGLRRARHPIVAIVDDDCAVRADWIAVVLHELAVDPGGIVCGQVLPAAGGDPKAVPSTIELASPRDYTGEIRGDVLYAGNMACPRDAVLAIGAFDERIVPAAEDCDLCYRWLRAGRRLRHVPDLVVWHRDWRTPAQLERQYIGYGHGQGMFYGKHLAAGDPRVLRFLARDLYAGGRGLAAAVVRGVPRWADRRRSVLRGIPRGLWDGIRLGRAR
jgi:GT2 family glycosyltransferase